MDKGSENFIPQGPASKLVNSLGIMGHMVSVATIWVCGYKKEESINYVQRIGWCFFSIKLYLNSDNIV